MRPAFRQGQLRLLLATLLVHALLGFVPLFGGPGYEAALALGILLPLPVAAASALRARRALHDESGSDPLQLLTASIRFALWLVLAHALVLALHGARVGFCDPKDGLFLFALGPATGTLLAATWGTLAGLISSRMGRGGSALALGLAAAGPVGGVLVSLGRFWTSPMVFAFDPFAGFFAGTLYDTVIDAVPRLITYRVGSLGSLLCAVCVCAGARVEDARLTLAPLRRRPGLAALAALGAGIALGVTSFGPELGHYQTTATIRRALGQVALGERCEIVYARGILPERAALLGRECDAHIAAHEAYFGTSFEGRVTVFTFASAQQKGWLMGASNTYIAKPWRREVYVQSDNYPHPVLGHELAHVVAGSFGRGPLHVAGPWGGWVPDPGRIEGFAVAAAPPEDSDYSLLEWTKALRDLELLPPLGSIFKLSFLGQNSSTGYTVAGAVVDWLRTRHGAAALRAWYGGSSIEEAFGEPLSALERAFQADLDRLPSSDRINEVARARFDRPAIFGRRCPHVVDELLDSAGAALEGFDLETAAQDYSRSLALDPSSYGARLGLAACAERAGDADQALDSYERLAGDESLSRVQRSSVFERLGDRALLAGRDHAAQDLYDDAERYAFDEHRARTIAVKRYALSDPEGRAAITSLLIGDVRLGSDMPQAMAALGEWSARVPQQGLADYLIGKNLYSRARWRDAYAYLERALRREIPLASVRREALRTFVFAACALGERDPAQAALQQYLVDPGLSFARKSGMQRLAKSCRLTVAP